MIAFYAHLMPGDEEACAATLQSVLSQPSRDLSVMESVEGGSISVHPDQPRPAADYTEARNAV